MISENIYFYYAFPLVMSIAFFWFLLYFYYTKRYTSFVKSFLDLANNIALVHDDKSTISINKIGLNFFGFESLERLNHEYSTISGLFIEEDGCVDKYTYGKDWLKILTEKNQKQIKVKLYSHIDEMEQYFHVQISNMKYQNQYLLIFNNITEIEQEKKEIRKLADYDALTKIYNRVKFNEIFPEVFYKANRYGEKFSVILFDIDHFKLINDNYGHNVGDKVLIELSRLVNMNLRETDIFARWGGEEFIIVAQFSTAEETIKLASRLQKEVENYTFDVVNEVRCSFGVTEFKTKDSQMTILERVDKALYYAKENGRNQVVLR